MREDRVISLRMKDQQLPAISCKAIEYRAIPYVRIRQ